MPSPSSWITLLEEGFELIDIRDLLVHVSVTTTEINAKCNVKIASSEEPDFSKTERLVILGWLKMVARPHR